MKSKMSIQLVKKIPAVFLFLVLKTPKMKIRLLKNLNKLMQCLRKRAVKVMEKKSGELGVSQKTRLQHKLSEDTLQTLIVKVVATPFPLGMDDENVPK